MSPSLSIGFVPLGWSTFATALAAQVMAEARQALTGSGCTLVGPESLVMMAKLYSWRFVRSALART